MNTYHRHPGYYNTHVMIKLIKKHCDYKLNKLICLTLNIYAPSLVLNKQHCDHNTDSNYVDLILLLQLTYSHVTYQLMNTYHRYPGYFNTNVMIRLIRIQCDYSLVNNQDNATYNLATLQLMNILESNNHCRNNCMIPPSLNKNTIQGTGGKLYLFDWKFCINVIKSKLVQYDNKKAELLGALFFIISE